MNEHDNLTPTEMESYRSALKESYPAPKTDIHANVMKQIRAERILMKKRARQKLFVKWGSVAACLLLVGMVALKVVPEVDKMMAPMAENSGGMAEDVSVARWDIRDNDEEDSVHCANENNSPADDYAPEAENSQDDPPAQFYGATLDDSKATDDNINVEKPEDMDLLNNGGKDSTEAEAPATEAPATEKPTTLAPETEEETEETEEEPETAAAEETK